MFAILTIFYITIGIIGFYLDNFILMIIANVLLILENLRGFLTGQLKSMFSNFICVFIGILISFIFHISWIKGITILLCFGSAILYIGGIILTFIIRERKTNEFK